MWENTEKTVFSARLSSERARSIADVRSASERGTCVVGELEHTLGGALDEENGVRDRRWLAWSL